MINVVTALSLFLFQLSWIAALAPAAAENSDVCDVRDFGAKPDDGAADTAEFQAAIDACKGTGRSVIVPAGQWDIGGLVLGSDMEFHLRAGAVAKLIPDMALYPKIKHDGPRSDGLGVIRTALYAPGARNLVISGPGTINGSGPEFWDENFYDLGIARPTLPRPEPTIELADCHNVHVRGLQLTNLASFALKFNRCDGVSATDVRIINERRSPNTDGIQITDTRNAFITRADIRTGDDAIVIKSYRRIVENIVVTDSYVESDDGAIKFGTQAYKGIHNTLFSNIVINNSRYGISLFQYDGGSYRNNRFENFVIKTGGRHARHYPLYVDVDRRTSDGPYGEIRDLVFSGISIDTSGASLIAGHPESPIRNLTLEGITITTPEDAFDLKESGPKPSGNKDVRRDRASTNYASVPAQIVVGNARHVLLSNIVVDDHGDAQQRAALALINLDDAVVDGVTVRTKSDVLIVENVRHLSERGIVNFARGGDEE